MALIGPVWRFALTVILVLALFTVPMPDYQPISDENEEWYDSKCQQAHGPKWHYQNNSAWAGYEYVNWTCTNGNTTEQHELVFA